MRARKAQQQAANTAQAVVERTVNQTSPGLKEHQSRTRRFDAAYQVWRGEPLAARPRQTGWQTNLRIKYGMQVIDQALVNLVQGVPKARILPRHQGDIAAAAALETVLGYYAEQDHLDESETTVAQQALIYGVSPAKNQWLYTERQTKGGPIVTADRPTFKPWDAYNCWWDPNAADVDTAGYVTLRAYMTKDQLEAGRHNAEDGTGTYQNLDLLYAAGQGERPPSTAQNQVLPPPEGGFKDRFEIWEIWRETPSGLRWTVIGNRQILLCDSPSPYAMAGKPIVISNSRPDLFRIEGISEAELADHIQQALHMIENLRLDQLRMTVLRGATVRETVPDMKQLVFRPSFLWPVTDHDDIRFQEPPPLPPEAYRETDVLLGRLQYVTGITPSISGTSADIGGVTPPTATGATLDTQAASRLLQFKASIIHQRTWQRTFEQWTALTKQFLTSDLEVRIVGPDPDQQNQQQVDGQRFHWRTYTPDQIIGDFDVKVEAGDEAATVAQERAESVALLQALAPWAQAGLCDPRPVLRRVAKAYGEMSPDELFPPAQPQQVAAPNGNQPPQQPGPNVLGNGIAPQAALSVLAGNRT